MRTLVLVMFFLALLPMAAAAHGRRPDYVSTGEGGREVHPVQRGSAANPNAAFTPPKFEDRSAPTRIPTAREPAAATAAPNATPSEATTPPPPPVILPPMPSAVGSSPSTAPPPPPPGGISGSDGSEPALPDTLGQDSSSSSIHPPAR